MMTLLWHILLPYSYIIMVVNYLDMVLLNTTHVNQLVTEEVRKVATYDDAYASLPDD